MGDAASSADHAGAVHDDADRPLPDAGACRVVLCGEHRTSETRKIEDRIGLSMLIASAVVAVLISLVEPKWALLGFVLNSLDAPLRRLVNRRARPGRG
jgi:hypothetical protein